MYIYAGHGKVHRATAGRNYVPESGLVYGRYWGSSSTHPHENGAILLYQVGVHPIVARSVVSATRQQSVYPRKRRSDLANTGRSSRKTSSKKPSAAYIVERVQLVQTVATRHRRVLPCSGVSASTTNAPLVHTVRLLLARPISGSGAAGDTPVLP